MAEQPVTMCRGTVIVLPIDEYRGTVTQVADGTDLRVGDEILYTKEPVVEIEIDEVTHQIVLDSNVLGWYVRAPDPEPIPPE